MTRLLAIPAFLFGVLFLCTIGMIGEITHNLGSGWSSGKVFGFTLMVMFALGGFVLLALSGVILVKGVPF
jgi:hypothetical protein